MKLSQRAIMLLGFTVLTMVGWIGVEVFLAQKKQIIRPIAEKAAPFSTDIKMDVLKALQERETFEEYTPVTTPIVIPTSSPSATPLPSPPPQSTPSAGQ